MDTPSKKPDNLIEETIDYLENLKLECDDAGVDISVEAMVAELKRELKEED